MDLGEDISDSNYSSFKQSSVEGDLADLTDGTRSETQENENTARIAAAYRTILECLGEDSQRNGLLNTPLRAAKALQFMTRGYNESVEDVVGGGIFPLETESDEMVIVRNIDIHSLCEHHMVPFSGKVHIAYIPDGKILGLSKLARIATMYSRRLQVQERLTQQIAQGVMDVVGAKGVGVVVEASHMCMVMRGVEKQGASTVTTALLGTFKSDPQVKREFYALLKLG